MKETTFTYTARSAFDRSKMAMFTLHNGSVSIALGNTLIEQVGEAYDTTAVEDESSDITTWVKPAATGALQKLLKPVALADFDAEMSNETLQATAWIRAGGLRLAPVMMTWQQVDNPKGAQAFVTELKERKKSIQEQKTLPTLLDYWVSWIAIGLMTIALPLLFIKKRQKQRS